VADPHALDRLASAAWPAQEVAERDGWLLRRAPGVTSRRVNAAHPPPGATDVPEQVLAWYRERGAVPQIHVSPAEHFVELDAVLAGRGWSHEAATDVVVGEAATLRSRLPDGEHPVRLTPVDEWLQRWRRIGGHRSGEPAAAEVIRRIDAETVPLVAERGGDTAGVALAVLQDGWSIVFEVAVAPEHRRHHVGLALMRAWADAAGDRRLQLQVDRANTPGHALYAKAGFRLSHGYHYRTAPS
jgi:ribosomal protein S18 acetylase RimI-like enzyme